MDMNQYLDIFIEEAREHLQQLNVSLLELEKDNRNKEVLNEVFRVAHTLKGMSGTMGFSKMQTLTHRMEDVLDALRNDRFIADSNMVDVLFKCLDALEIYVNTIAATAQEGDEAFLDVVGELQKIMQNTGSGEKAENKASMPDKAKDIKKEEPAVKSEIVELNQYDINVIKRAIETDMNVFQIHVVLDKGCLLKAARAFIVFQILEKNSEVIKSIPKVEDIEDERFGYDFTVVVITEKTEEFFKQEINSVAEISAVEIVPVILDDLDSTEAEEEDFSNNDIDKIEAVASAALAQNNTADQHKKFQKTGKTVRVDIERLDILMNLVSELIIIKTRLEESSVSKDDANVESIEYLERITTSLHDAVMRVRMVPVETVFNRFPRMIRDISRELKKDIELHMSGEETELDRTVIDEIGDPLIHILRNSADHGLETHEERLKVNKSAAGNIYLRAFQDGNNVVIEVEDDGRGIDVEKVRKKIIQKGMESQEFVSTLSDKEVIEYLFKPNFSTADKVTDLSGRGVGLDVVKTKIEALGGIVEVDSTRGKGSKFIIRIPLTLAIIQALLVKIGSEKYAIPLGSIQEIENVKPQDIRLVRNQEVILLRDMVIPIVRLGNILGVPDAVPDEEKKSITCVIAKKGEKLSAFMVDSLIGQQEIVIKSLGKILAGVKYIAGATILGDGNVALILDVNSLAI
ncbi:MAG: chemotaxis protein CheA [Clostridiaceae bacterium]|jgi:two-component system chemotaxis sensor kinase CheA|nr:chemotaxis protein CheA [Clostridiaceae bacterium]